jgi:hypothetical protein
MGCSGSSDKKRERRNLDMIQRMDSIPEFRVALAQDKNGNIFTFVL